MTLTPVFIILCVAFTLWLLLLLVIVSRINALNSRIGRLTSLLNEFDNLEKSTQGEEQRIRAEVQQAGTPNSNPS